MPSRVRQLLNLLSAPFRPHAAASLLMSVLFVVSGIGKLGSIDDTQEYMEAYGVPGYLIYPAAAFEISSGIALVTGLLPKQLCIAVAAWCLLTAAIFHAELTDQTQKIMFMKNLAMAGGFLVLADDGWSSRRILNHDGVWTDPVSPSYGSENGKIRLSIFDEEAGHEWAGSHGKQ